MPAASYDVVIIGAGPAGLSTALTLGRLADLKILVADSGQPASVRPGESIPPAALSCIHFLQLEEAFKSSVHFPYPGNVSLWGRNTIGYNDALLDPMGLPWRLDRLRFDQMLAEAVQSFNIEIAWGLHFIKQQSNDDGFELEFTDRKQSQQVAVKAKFVVDATGAGARFARSAGATRVVQDQMVALTCTQDIMAGDITSQTLIEADEDGWWYVSKLPGNQLITMYVTTAQTLKQMNRDVQQHFQLAGSKTLLLSKHLNTLTLNESPFYRFPIYSSYLEKAHGPNWLAVGDAASCYDPVAAQGVYKGLSNGIRAAKSILKIFENRADAIATSELYTTHIRSNYHVYSENRKHLYQLEQRWPDAPFWQNRQRIR
jgi:flavin-dependent dehydrogenase